MTTSLSVAVRLDTEGGSSSRFPEATTLPPTPAAGVIEKISSFAATGLFRARFDAGASGAGAFLREGGIEVVLFGGCHRRLASPEARKSQLACFPILIFARAPARARAFL